MKSWLLSLGSIALAGALLVSTGCTKDPEQYTVVFKQEGQKDIVYTVNEGADFKNLPQPKEVTGYTVVWDRTTLQNITEDIVVNAVATPNEYTITYVLEDGETLDEYTQTVVYDAQYELKTPTKPLYKFDGWYNDGQFVEQSGKWEIASDVTLTALWTEEGAAFYEIKFVHIDGTEEIVEVETSTTLTADRVPTCKQITGYTVTWETDDFSTIRIVNAVKTPKTYHISYQSEEGVTVPAPITVTYGEAYQLEEAINSNTNLMFNYWKNAATGEKVASKGTWNIDSDVELVAEWVDLVGDFTQNH